MATVLDLQKLAAEIAALPLEWLGDLLGGFTGIGAECDKASAADLEWLALDIRLLFAQMEVEGAGWVAERLGETWEDASGGSYATMWLACSEGVGALTLEGEVELLTWEEVRNVA